MFIKKLLFCCLLFFTSFAADGAYQFCPEEFFVGYKEHTDEEVFFVPGGFHVGLQGAFQPGQPHFRIIPAAQMIQRVPVYIQVPVAVPVYIPVGMQGQQHNNPATNNASVAQRNSHQQHNNQHNKQHRHAQKTRSAEQQQQVPLLPIIDTHEQDSPALVVTEQEGGEQKGKESQNSSQKSDAAPQGDSVQPQSGNQDQLAGKTLWSAVASAPADLQQNSGSAFETKPVAAFGSLSDGLKEAKIQNSSKDNQSVSQKENGKKPAAFKVKTTVVSDVQASELATQSNAVVVSSSGIDAKPGKGQIAVGSGKKEEKVASSSTSSKKKTEKPKQKKDTTISDVDFQALLNDASRENGLAAQKIKEEQINHVFMIYWLLGMNENVINFFKNYEKELKDHRNSYDFILGLAEMYGTLSHKKTKEEAPLKEYSTVEETVRAVFYRVQHINDIDTTEELSKDEGFIQYSNDLVLGLNCDKKHTLYSLVQAALYNLRLNQKIFLPEKVVEFKKSSFAEEYYHYFKHCLSICFNPEVSQCRFLKDDGTIVNLSAFLAATDCAFVKRNPWLSLREDFTTLLYQLSSKEKKQFQLHVSYQLPLYDVHSDFFPFFQRPIDNLHTVASQLEEDKDIFCAHFQNTRFLFLSLVADSVLSLVQKSKRGGQSKKEVKTMTDRCISKKDLFKKSFENVFRTCSRSMDEKSLVEMEQLALFCNIYNTHKTNVKLDPELDQMIGQNVIPFVDALHKEYQKNTKNNSINSLLASFDSLSMLAS